MSEHSRSRRALCSGLASRLFSNCLFATECHVLGNGDDSHDGETPATARRSVQKAAGQSRDHGAFEQ